MKEQLPVIVVSKVKQTVREIGLNTSQETIDVLNKKIHDLLVKASESAKQDGRKTLMARDFNGLI